MVKEERRQKRHRIAGYMLIGWILALVLLVTFIDDLKRLFEGRYTIYAVFPTAPALTRGSAVWIAGKQVGEVRSIGLLPVRGDTAPGIAVELDLPRDSRELVRIDSRVELASARMISEPVVNILPGSLAAAPLPPGDTLYAARTRSALDLMNVFRGLWASMDTLFQQLQQVSPLAQRRGDQFAALSSRLQQVNVEFAALARGFESGTLSIFSHRSELRRSLDQMNATVAQIRPALERALGRYSDPELRAAFERVQLRADSVTAQLAGLRELMANSSLTRFQTDSAIVFGIRGAQAQLDSLLAETKRNPLRFWF